MAKKIKGPVVSFASLRDGYTATIENAIRFVGAAEELMSSYPDKALALAQLGQEEVGKSLSMLSAFALPPEERAWEWFWDSWSNHQLKAHRAYLYEIISPIRIEVVAPGGKVHAGEPLRPKLSQEKESGFYVDFDVNRKSFVSPESRVSLLEAGCRLSTLSYLAITADGVRRALLHEDDQFRLTAFGELAYRICTEVIYQQDMPAIVDEFRKRSARHDEIIRHLGLHWPEMPSSCMD
jgi:AbiV family abortive infection protein